MTDTLPPDLLTHPARPTVAGLVHRYLVTAPGARPSAVHVAHLAGWIKGQVRWADLDEAALAAAISSAVWRPTSATCGWERRRDLTEGELVNAALSAFPYVEPHPLILTDKPGLTGESSLDMERFALWHRQEEALLRLSGKTVSLDFDATLQTYTHWTGIIPTGEPTPYAVELIAVLLDAGVKVVVSTCRAAEPGGLVAVKEWLAKHIPGHDLIEVTSEKPQAVAYIDDRAVPYRGTWLDCLEAAAALVGKAAWHQDEPVPPGIPPTAQVAAEGDRLVCVYPDCRDPRDPRWHDHEPAVASEVSPYTQHGHLVRGYSGEGWPTPASVARCGGEALCGPCSRDAARIRLQ